MIHADYYEPWAYALRVQTLAHLRECAECGRECCTDYQLVPPYADCPLCGTRGNSAQVVDGKILCGFCY